MLICAGKASVYYVGKKDGTVDAGGHWTGSITGKVLVAANPLDAGWYTEGEKLIVTSKGQFRIFRGNDSPATWNSFEKGIWTEEGSDSNGNEDRPVPATPRSPRREPR